MLDHETNTFCIYLQNLQYPIYERLIKTISCFRD